MQFLKDNICYMLWFVLYFLIAWAILGFTGQGFLIALITYGISIAIALSPIGEWILKKIQGVRKPTTRQEREYLEPLFEEVYQNALEKNPNLSRNIELHICDEMFVNAFAMGKNTIAVTIGAMETFTEEELKGVMAHEFGHIAHGHTKALLISVVGNSIFSVIVLVLRFVMSMLELIGVIGTNTANEAIITIIISRSIRFLINMAIFAFMGIGQIILSINSRLNEYQADKFAGEIGYNEQLIESLYLLQKIAGSQKMTLKQRMVASHPHIAERIGRLENKMN